MRKTLQGIAALFLTTALATGLAWGESSRAALHYTGYTHGLPVLSFSVDLSRHDQSYQVGVEYHTTGLYGLFFPVERQVSASGIETGSGTRPERFEINGEARGHVYHAILHFGQGLPQVDDESPQQTSDDWHDQFQPVPPALTADSTDHISAVLGLLRQETVSGKCDADVHVFDGRILSDLRAASAPDEALEAENGSSFSGMAHKCTFTGSVLAGGPKPPPQDDDDDQAERMREKQPPPGGAAWMAPIGPDGQMELVRVAFTAANGSVVTLYLDQTTPEPIVAASN
jgi:hypothetical protein